MLTLHLSCLLSIPQHHVRDMNGGFHFYNTTFSVLCRRLCVLGDDVGTFHNHFTFFYQYFLHQTWLFQIFVITGDHHYGVALPDVVLWFKSCFHFYYLTVFIAILILPGYLCNQLLISI